MCDQIINFEITDRISLIKDIWETTAEVSKIGKVEKKNEHLMTVYTDFDRPGDIETML